MTLAAEHADVQPKGWRFYHQARRACNPTAEECCPSASLHCQRRRPPRSNRTASSTSSISEEATPIFWHRPPVGQVRSLGEFEETGAVLIAGIGLARFLVNLIALSLEHADVWVVTWNEAESNLVRRIRPEHRHLGTQLLWFPHGFWTGISVPSPWSMNWAFPNLAQSYYNERRRDDAIPTLMGRFAVTEVYRPAATEGEIMSNGEGICVVTNWFLQENPRLSAEHPEHSG